MPWPERYKQMTKPLNDDALSRLRLFLYALPFAAASLQSNPFTSFLSGFYSTDLALPLAMVGLAISITRLSDIFTDILIGMASDRIRTRWGRRRPMVAFGIPFAMISVWMLFVPPQQASVGYLFIWVIAFNLAISMIEVPYGAWGAELSRNYDERTRVQTWKTTAATLGSLFAFSIPILLQKIGQGDTRSMLMWMAIAYVFIQPLFFLPILIFGKEEAPREVIEVRITFAESLLVLWRNPAFRNLSLGLFLFVGGKAISQSLTMIVITEVIEARPLFPTILLLESVSGLVAVALWLWVAKRIGKAKAMLAAALWSGAWTIPLFFLGPGDGWLFGFFICMRAISLFSWVILIPSMTADAVDLDTLASGRERTGVFFGALSFSAKAAAAAGVLIGTSLPALAGFQPSDPQHTPDGLLALRAVYALLGPAFVIASAFVFYRFPITREKQAEVREAIEKRIEDSKLASAKMNAAGE
jgi:glycoside/pentoside/hexuronide:cation symporter, GPH family